MTQVYPDQHKKIVLKFTEMSGDNTQEMISISSIASHESQIVTIDSDLIEPTMPYGFGRQLPFIPPILNNLNLSPNPFNNLATMALVNPKEDGHDENYSPQSPEPSDPSPISTPPMNLSTIDDQQTPHTTKEVNIFYSEGEHRRIYLLSTPSPPSPPHKMKRNLEMRMSFPKRRTVSQDVREACGEVNPRTTDIPGLSTKDWRLQRH